MACPDHNELAAFAEGGLSAEARGTIQGHIDTCSECFTIIVELARLTQPESAGMVTDLSWAEEVKGAQDNQKPLVPPPSDESGMSSIIGAVLDKRYTIDRLIGKGGFAEVYRGRQLSVGRDVAIKVLTSSLTTQGELTRRFEAEAKIISKLKHPNTLRLFDFGRTDDGRLYIVIELLDGAPIDEVLALGPIDEKRMCIWLKQICGALQEAHDAGIYHRDLKPSNLFLEHVGGQDFVKILDFGIAKVADTKQTTTGMIMGTPCYMSPEQVEALPVDHRTDLYSLGVVVFEALAGQAPFQGDTPVSVMYKHAKLVAPDIRELKADLHPAMGTLVRSLLAKNPDERPASAKAVAEFIDAIDWNTTVSPVLTTGGTAHGLPRPATVEGPVAQTPAPAESKPEGSGPPWGWLAFGCLALVVGGMWMTQTPEPPAAPEVAPQTAVAPAPIKSQTAVAPPPTVVADATVIDATVAAPDAAPEKTNRPAIQVVKLSIRLSPKKAMYDLSDTPRLRSKATGADGEVIKGAPRIKWRVKPAGLARVDRRGFVKFTAEGKGTITGCIKDVCDRVSFYAEPEDI